MSNPISFRYFKTSPETIQLAVRLYVRFPLSLRNVEDLLHKRGVDDSKSRTLKSLCSIGDRGLFVFGGGGLLYGFSLLVLATTALEATGLY